MAETASIKDELKRSVEAAVEGKGRRLTMLRMASQPLQKLSRNNRWCSRVARLLPSNNQDRQ